ncbi:MAG: acyl-CoA dehydrogenase [Oceanospirillaceae bacterium]|nr:acyl-CoA dehydrogenase [Oceanospirillaceae bacterium]MBT4443398.1 acyl-CoA dehydrogenase [Oceanospirillaceae bacterium]MBT6078633.1 acyl-CoA dehydrogenase [Oceanospirillaceae bacterium]MBT7330065.1 acyl-CoA dehydrogenase [Oceanospirillaceae bacterium]
MFTDTAAWVSTEHRLYADGVQRFMEQSMAPNIESWCDQGVVDRDFWFQAGEAGIMGASVPEAYGGAGADLSFEAITIYTQAYLADINWGYGIQSIVMHYLVAYGTEDQKRRWLPKLVSGELVSAIAMTEPGCGSDLKAVASTAKRDGDSYVINGSKTFITNGQTAELICVVVKTDLAAGSKGTSLIFVETDQAQGFQRGRNLKKLGMKGNDTSELFFEDVRVPVDNLLGGIEGQGFYQLMNQLVWERSMIGITALGAMDCGLQQTIEYVRQRKAFGQPIMAFQNTRFKLAEMKTKVEVTRSFINDCIAKLIDGSIDPATASMAKYWGSQVQNEVLDECVQLHGGYGYMMEYPITRLFADARVQKIYGGTNEIMKELIARSLDV